MRTDVATVFFGLVICGVASAASTYSCFNPPLAEGQTNPFGAGLDHLVEAGCCEALTDESDIHAERLVVWDPFGCHYGPSETPITEAFLCQAHDTDGCRFCHLSCEGLEGLCIPCNEIFSAAASPTSVQVAGAIGAIEALSATTSPTSVRVAGTTEAPSTTASPTSVRATGTTEALLDTPPLVSTLDPTSIPSLTPTSAITLAPTLTPTLTTSPTSVRVASTIEPLLDTLTLAPISAPTLAPTLTPTSAPTLASTSTASPTSYRAAGTTEPFLDTPTSAPTLAPTFTPTLASTSTPTLAPTSTPISTAIPSSVRNAGTTEPLLDTPTLAPTSAPTSLRPSAPVPTPTSTASPTSVGVAGPTEPLFDIPTSTPTSAPTSAPTLPPTAAPTLALSSTPTLAPTLTLPKPAPTTSAPVVANDNESDCECVENMSATEADVLAIRGKTMRCDPTCSNGEDLVWGVLNCNYFGLGQDCRTCADTCEQWHDGVWIDKNMALCKPCSAIP